MPPVTYGVRNNASRFGSVLFEDSTLITGETQCIRLWDLREKLDKPTEEIFVNDVTIGINNPRAKTVKRMKALDENRLIAQVNGMHGLVRFDLRKERAMKCYEDYAYPGIKFATGDEVLDNYFYSSGENEANKFCVTVYDKNPPFKAVNRIVAPHKSNITKLKVSDDKIITASRDELRVMHLGKQPNGAKRSAEIRIKI